MFIGCDTSEPHLRCEHRAGFIKSALESTPENAALSGPYLKLFKAAAIAAHSTGAPLMVHIEKGSDPVGLADFLEENNVDLRKVIFCHMDRMIPDLGIHKDLCKRGIFMEYDTIGREKYHNDLRETEIIIEMIDCGFEDKLLMALDVTRDRMIHYGGHIGLAYIKKTFIPLLLERGLENQVVDKIFIKNPASAFCHNLVL
jgi:phosphotriesterase-related protein